MIGAGGQNLSTFSANTGTTVPGTVAAHPAPRTENPVELGDLKVTRYETSHAVATITLDRPARLNAWTGRMDAESGSCWPGRPPTPRSGSSW